MIEFEKTPTRDDRLLAYLLFFVEKSFNLKKWKVFSWLFYLDLDLLIISTAIFSHWSWLEVMSYDFLDTEIGNHQKKLLLIYQKHLFTTSIYNKNRFKSILSISIFFVGVLDIFILIGWLIIWFNTF